MLVSLDTAGINIWLVFIVVALPLNTEWHTVDFACAYSANNGYD